MAENQEKFNFLGKIKNLINTTEEDYEEKIKEEEQVVMKEVVFKQDSKIADLNKVRLAIEQKEKEEKEKQDALKLKESIKEELKEELKAEIIGVQNVEKNENKENIENVENQEDEKIDISINYEKEEVVVEEKEEPKTHYEEIKPFLSKKEQKELNKLEKKAEKQAKKEEKRFEKQRREEEILSENIYTASLANKSFARRNFSKLVTLYEFLNEKPDEFSPQQVGFSATKKGNPHYTAKKQKRKKQSGQVVNNEDENLSLPKTYVNGVEVPHYKHEGAYEKISLAGDRISYVIKKEYSTYIKMAKDEVKRSEKEQLREEKINKAIKKEEEKEITYAKKKEKANTEEKVEVNKSIKERLFGSYINATAEESFAQFRQVKEESTQDFERKQDARSVNAEISIEKNKALAKSIAVGLAFLISLAFLILQRFSPQILTQNVPNSDIVVSVSNLILLVISLALSHLIIINGLKPLLSFKGNEETAVAVASIATAIQAIISVFFSASFFNLERNLYVSIALFLLFVTSLGKFVMQARVKNNFKFLSNNKRKYIVKMMNDEENASKMISKTKADKPYVAFQRRTNFLKRFLKLSYTPDISQNALARVAPFCTAFAVFVSIVYGIVFNNFIDAVAVLTALLCVSVPVCGILSQNILMNNLCRKAIKKNSMIVGFPSVREFSQTRAVMIDSRQLYPRTKVNLVTIKVFNENRSPLAFRNAAAVLKVANTPLTYMFEQFLSDDLPTPAVDIVKYEDGKGLVSFIANEKLLIGTRDFMILNKVDVPSVDFEQINKEAPSDIVTYIAIDNELIAMIVTEYKVDKKIAKELKKLEKLGVTLLVRTAEPNITQALISNDFNLYHKFVKILPADLGNVCKEEMAVIEQNSVGTVLTRGKLTSLAFVLSRCIKIQNNISLVKSIQVVSIVVGLILSIVIIFTGLTGLRALEVLIYLGFWSLVSIIAPKFLKI